MANRNDEDEYGAIIAFRAPAELIVATESAAGPSEYRDEIEFELKRAKGLSEAR